MRKRLKDDELEYLKTNTSRGPDFNKQLMAIQVENVYAQDELKKEIVGLEKVIVKSNEQSALTEKSNQRLQAAMFMLTLVTVSTAIFGVSEEVYKIIGYTGSNLLIYSTATTAALTVIVMLLISREIEKW